jgi:hypothetical protein
MSQPDSAAQAAEMFDADRLLFGSGMPWWKWTVHDDNTVDMPSKAVFREHEEGYGIFKGKLRDHLSYGNMDGWASVQSAETLLDLSSAQGLELGVRGDGKTYRFTLTANNTRSLIEYIATIPAKASAHKWRTVRIPWASFTPCFKGGKIAGVTVDQVPVVDPAQITSLGFGVGDRQWGAFLLECAYIKTY